MASYAVLFLILKYELGLTLAWQVIDLELPIQLKAKVTQTDPGLKGDTAGGGELPPNRTLLCAACVPVLVVHLSCAAHAPETPSLSGSGPALSALMLFSASGLALAGGSKPATIGNRSDCVSALVHCGGRRIVIDTRTGTYMGRA